MKDQAETGDYKNTSILSISLKDGERFYGGGSTSRDHIQHRGELLRMWTTYQHTEIPMPFMISSENWGIFNNTTRKNFFDIGNYQSDVFSIYNTTDEVDFYLMFGNSMIVLLLGTFMSLYLALITSPSSMHNGSAEVRKTTFSIITRPFRSETDIAPVFLSTFSR